MPAQPALGVQDRTSAPRDLRDLPPRAVVIHGGMHKTGSSSLQNALAASPDVLADAGWLYPRAGLVDQEELGLQHWTLMAQMRDPVPTPAWDQLRAEIDRWPGRVLISHENFFSPQVDPQRVMSELPGRDVFVVAYVRHPVDYLESCYREWVRRWGVMCSARVYYGQWRPYMDLPRLVSAWEAAAGPGRVLLRAYDRDHLIEGSTPSDLTALLGVSGLASDVSGSNESLNSRQVLVRLVANRMGIPAEVQKRRNLTTMLSSPETSAETLAGLPLIPVAGVDARKLYALRRLLSSRPAPRARIADDELVADVEQACLPGFRSALEACGATADAEYRSTDAAAPQDPTFSDEGLRAAIATLLG